MSEITLNTEPRRTTPTSINEIGGSLVKYDGNFWKDQNTTVVLTTSVPMTGYEGFNVRYSAQDTGTTEYKKFVFDNGDGDITTKSGSRTYTTTYNNITLRGKPDSRERVRNAFIPYLTGYDQSDAQTITTIGDNSGTVEVLERWPTAQFYASGDNDNGVAVFNEDRIVYGYEPTTVYFTDATIARTFPISGWFIDYADTIIESYTTTDGALHPANEIVVHPNMFNHTYSRANTYYVTLYTEASTTATQSANTFTTAEELLTNPLSTAATVRVDVYPYNQINNFYLISGESVSSNYTSDSPDALSSVSTYGGTFISGYAPNLTVMFQESCTPVSFPISAYDWDFGDVYRSDVTHQTVSATSVETGFGAGWVTDKTNHYISYTYKFPGLYNVSLGSRVSADPTYNPKFTYTLNGSPCSRNLLVYVQEVNPIAEFGVSNVSGGPFDQSVVFTSSPMTIYFNASTTIPGSYPIGRVMWDFGDGTFQNVISSYSEPEPHKVTVSHQYIRETKSDPSTFSVSYSAFANDTDTMSEYIITGLGPLNVTPASALYVPDWPQHLLETAFYNDKLLFVFEGNKRNTFVYILTGAQETPAPTTTTTTTTTEVL